MRLSALRRLIFREGPVYAFVSHDGGGEQKQRPKSHVGRAIEGLVEAYSPGWAKGESRVLDTVGRGTERLFWKLYGRELSREESIAFLHRRLYYCFFTGISTLLQIILSFLGYDIFCLLLTALLLPITVLDRQWCALVTRMQSRYDRSRIKRLAVYLARALSAVETTHGMPMRFGLSGKLMLLGGLEMLVAAMQFAAAACIVMYTLWRTMFPWERETLTVLFAVAVLRVCKEVLNVVSPLIELKRQPAVFDRNEDCIRQIFLSLCSQAETTHDLALLMHKHPESQEAFMSCCTYLCQSVVCSHVMTHSSNRQVEMGNAAEGEDTEASMLMHVHDVECLPAFMRGKWRGEKQDEVLRMMLQAGQIGPCWWDAIQPLDDIDTDIGTPPKMIMPEESNKTPRFEQ